MLQIQLNTACEGPLALNDHAFSSVASLLNPMATDFSPR